MAPRLQYENKLFKMPTTGPYSPEMKSRTLSLYKLSWDSDARTFQYPLRNISVEVYHLGMHFMEVKDSGAEEGGGLGQRKVETLLLGPHFVDL